MNRLGASVWRKSCLIGVKVNTYFNLISAICLQFYIYTLFFCANYFDVWHASVFWRNDTSVFSQLLAPLSDIKLDILLSKYTHQQWTVSAEMHNSML